MGHGSSGRTGGRRGPVERPPCHQDYLPLCEVWAGQAIPPSGSIGGQVTEPGPWGRWAPGRWPKRLSLTVQGVGVPAVGAL